MIVFRLCPRSWSAFAGSKAELGRALDPGEKVIAAEGAAYALARAQAIERLHLRFRDEKVGKPRKAIFNGRERGESVVLAAKMRARTRPAPVLGAFNETCPHRIERHIPQGRRKMILSITTAPKRPCQKWPVRLRRA